MNTLGNRLHSSDSREIGLELLEATSRLEEPLGIRWGLPRVDVVALAFAVRARRLLRATYRLLDAKLPEAATPLLRILTEYMIVARWIWKGGEQRAFEWAMHDLRERRATLLDVVRDPKLYVEPRKSLEAELAAVEEAIRRFGGPNAALSKRQAAKAGEAIPPVEQMARDLGLHYAYSISYRVMSQIDVHATAAALDAVYDDEPSASDPGRRLRTVPRHALDKLDLYSAGARLLLDILGPLNDRMPELGWNAMLAEFSTRLQTAPTDVDDADTRHAPP